MTRAGVSRGAPRPKSGDSILVAALPPNAECATSLPQAQFPCLDGKTGCAYSGENSEGKLGQQPPRVRVAGEAALQESKHGQGRGQTPGAEASP